MFWNQFQGVWARNQKEEKAKRVSKFGATQV